MIFYVNMGENFRGKGQFVADGQKIQNMASMTYSYVVSRESVWITLTIAALNYLDILTCDIQNDYLTAEWR